MVVVYFNSGNVAIFGSQFYDKDIEKSERFLLFFFDRIDDIWCQKFQTR